MFVTLFVCTIIQIHISEPIGTKLRTHLPLGLEETVRYVWAHNISPFPTFSTSSVARPSMMLRKNGCRRHGVSPQALYP
jgi:hypothetical protein